MIRVNQKYKNRHLSILNYLPKIFFSKREEAALGIIPRQVCDIPSSSDIELQYPEESASVDK